MGCAVDVHWLGPTPDAAAVVRALARAFGDAILLGMGTLTNPAQAAEALDAGARYLVSPITDEALGRAMVATGLRELRGGGLGRSPGSCS